MECKCLDTLNPSVIPNPVSWLTSVRLPQHRVSSTQNKTSHCSLKPKQMLLVWTTVQLTKISQGAISICWWTTLVSRYLHDNHGAKATFWMPLHDFIWTGWIEGEGKKPPTLAIWFISLFYWTKASWESTNPVTVAPRATRARIPCCSPGTANPPWWICSVCHPTRALRMTAASPCAWANLPCPSKTTFRRGVILWSKENQLYQQPSWLALLVSGEAEWSLLFFM